MDNSFGFSPTDECINVCTWNVEGLTDIKIEQICKYTRSNSTDVTFLQNTRRNNSDNFVTNSGHEVVLICSSAEGRKWAGVGCIIAPGFRKAAIGFRPDGGRMASLRVTTATGPIAFIVVYAHTIYARLKKGWLSTTTWIYVWTTSKLARASTS